jgi:hypothetical protein
MKKRGWRVLGVKRGMIRSQMVEKEKNRSSLIGRECMHGKWKVNTAEKSRKRSTMKENSQSKKGGYQRL